MYEMTNMKARLLFIPVSGPHGMGEYARSLAIAKAAVRRWPGTEVHFALSRHAPYAADVPFPATLFPSSPTFHPREVSALIRDMKPTVVIFDNAGRTAQLRAASKAGARVVYISSRPRQRHKAFRLKWLGIIDEHWIAYPEFIAGSVTAFERFKLRMFGRPRTRFLGTLLPAAGITSATAVMERFNIRPREYVLVVPGGGTSHPGAENAPEIVAAAAREIAQHGYPTVLVGISKNDSGAGLDNLRHAPRLPMDQLLELIRGARMVISNGGDTMLQVLASRRPCIAVPIAADQAHRIACCVDAGLVVGAKLDATALVNEALARLENRQWPKDLEERFDAREVTNDMDGVLDALARLTAQFDPPEVANDPDVVLDAFATLTTR
jgi:ADP-heptose:LPS heptosyltransferase